MKASFTAVLLTEWAHIHWCAIETILNRKPPSIKLKILNILSNYK